MFAALWKKWENYIKVEIYNVKNEYTFFIYNTLYLPQYNDFHWSRAVWVYGVIDGYNKTWKLIERNNFYYLLAHTYWLSYHRAMPQTDISMRGLFCVRCTRSPGFLVVGKWVLLFHLWSQSNLAEHLLSFVWHQLMPEVEGDSVRFGSMLSDDDGVRCRQYPLHDWLSSKALEPGGQNDG